MCHFKHSHYSFSADRCDHWLIDLWREFFFFIFSKINGKCWGEKKRSLFLLRSEKRLKKRVVFTSLEKTQREKSGWAEVKSCWCRLFLWIIRVSTRKEKKNPNYFVGNDANAMLSEWCGLAYFPEEVLIIKLFTS